MPPSKAIEAASESSGTGIIAVEVIHSEIPTRSPPAAWEVNGAGLLFGRGAQVLSLLSFAGTKLVGLGEKILEKFSGILRGLRCPASKPLPIVARADAPPSL